DYRYTGNSRFLFDKMRADRRLDGYDLRFMTDNELVDDRYRLPVDDIDSIRMLARAEMVIAETWIPGWMKKREGSTWVQLWHGTPLKKMLFDSSEPAITKTK